MNTLKPEISILHGDDPSTGIHLFRPEGGTFTGTTNDRDVREILPVVEAVIADLLVVKAELQGMVDDINAVEAKRIAREERKSKDKWGIGENGSGN